MSGCDLETFRHAIYPLFILQLRSATFHLSSQTRK